MPPREFILIVVAALALLGLIALALGLLWLHARRIPADAVPPSARDEAGAELPQCLRCGLKLMRTDDGALLCPACEIRYVPETPGATLDRFPDGFREESDYEPGPDPRNDGTFFGI
jgi:hypothetical protein